MEEEQVETPKVMRDLGAPAKEEWDSHCIAHLPPREWCSHCARGSTGRQDQRRALCVRCLQVPHCRGPGCNWDDARCEGEIDGHGWVQRRVAKWVDQSGTTKCPSDATANIRSCRWRAKLSETEQKEVRQYWSTLLLARAQRTESSNAERGRWKEWNEKMLYTRGLQRDIPADSNILEWTVEHAGCTLSGYSVGKDATTAHVRW